MFKFTYITITKIIIIEYILNINSLRTKAFKLKAYYTKLCQDEEKSFKRNQSILNDIQRVDSQFQQFESKLERLSGLKVLFFFA